MTPRANLQSGDSRDLFEDNPRRALDDLLSRAIAYRTAPELKCLFEFTRRFPHMAPFNAMLLHIQNPGVRYALRAPVWHKEYERTVRSGARPYVILRTMGPVAFVFDLSDTEPLNPSRDLVPEIVKNPFPAKGQPPQMAITRLKRGCNKAGIEVVMQDLGSGLAGDVRRTRPGVWEFMLRLNAKHTEAQQLATMAHELAHVFCGHLGPDRAKIAPDRPLPPIHVREFEAEAVTYLVTYRLNLDVGSVEYLAGYMDDPLPDYSLDAVLKAAGKVEEMLHGRFRLKREQTLPG